MEEMMPWGIGTFMEEVMPWAYGKLLEERMLWEHAGQIIWGHRCLGAYWGLYLFWWKVWIYVAAEG
jgi:hypothetical protein